MENFGVVVVVEVGLLFPLFCERYLSAGDDDGDVAEEDSGVETLSSSFQGPGTLVTEKGLFRNCEIAPR